MSREQQLISREIKAKEPFISGSVIGRPRIAQFDGAATKGVMWVCDVEIGSNRPLLNVPIKSGGDLSHNYAMDGAAVLLRRNAAGRFQVVGPGDRANANTITSDYDLATQAQVGGEGAIGTARVLEPFEFYMGPAAVKGNPALLLTPAAFDTITRTVGSWIDEGFLVGELIRIGKGATVAPGFGGTVSIVTDLVLTLNASNFTAIQGPVTGITVIQGTTSRWNNGTDTFPVLRLVNAAGIQIFPS